VTQKEQVIAAMEGNGGFATFSELNRLVDVRQWGTNTPYASIRRIVQSNPNDFYRIVPGQWGLISHRTRLESEGATSESESYTHGYFQGILVELGNLKEDMGALSNHQRPCQTYVPPQDKNRLYSHRRLGDLASMSEIVRFTSDKILRKARTVDTIWFNGREMPVAFFEVEHTTDIQNSLDKFFELQDFNAKFYIISSNGNRRRFDDLLNYSRYEEIKRRVCFKDYEWLTRYHNKRMELAAMAI